MTRPYINRPVGSDSDLTGRRFTPGPEDHYIIPEMIASVERAADEPTSGKRFPIVDPVTGEVTGFSGTKTLKPEWMKVPGRRGEYFSNEDTLSVLRGMHQGIWPTTKRREVIAEQIEQALYLDAEEEKARASGVGVGPMPSESSREIPAFVSEPVEARPRVKVDLGAGTFTLRDRSPYKGKVVTVNPGHRVGCRCVGCSPVTRARGMQALQAANRRRLTPKASAFISRHISKHRRVYGMPPAQAVRVAYEEAAGKGYRVPPALNPVPDLPRVAVHFSRAEADRSVKRLADAGLSYVNLVPGPRGSGLWFIHVFPKEEAAALRVLRRRTSNPLTRKEQAEILRSAHGARRLSMQSRRLRDKESELYWRGRFEGQYETAGEYGGPMRRRRPVVGNPDPPIPDLVRFALQRYASEGARAWEWPWFQIGSAKDRDDVDAWLVRIKHPLAYEAGTAEQRFRSIVEELAHQGRRNPRVKPSYGVRTWGDVLRALVGVHDYLHTLHPYQSNPLTRSETQDVLREADEYVRVADMAPLGSGYRQYGLGRAHEARSLAVRYGAKRNPPALVHARVLGPIPGEQRRAEYRRTGRHPGRYYHNWGRGVRAYALSDGGLYWRGPRRLHSRD